MTVLCIWTGGLDSLLQFADFANNIHGDIKLELRYSKGETVLLDTMVKKEGDCCTQAYILNLRTNNFIYTKRLVIQLTPKSLLRTAFDENKTNMRE